MNNLNIVICITVAISFISGMAVAVFFVSFIYEEEIVRLRAIIAKWKDSYENMRRFAQENGLDTSARNL